MSSRVGVAVFPGTWSDRDCLYAARLLGADAVPLWHQDRDLQGSELVILPGGFAYGDYLRAGAVARFAPLMEAVADHARAGGAVLGICNGFQILCEAGLLPGALLRNQSLQFRCQPTTLRITSPRGLLAGLADGERLTLPISHGEGRYHASLETLARLEAEGRVALRYCDEGGRLTAAANPNGSLANIAGVLNETGNVLGMMPHPERACEPLLGSSDGLRLLRSALRQPSLA
ncbi:MAG: phosphoribosylformylglycinamidine synthase subunit PurQ [Candidatus Dormibacteria bacterium]